MQSYVIKQQFEGSLMFHFQLTIFVVAIITFSNSESQTSQMNTSERKAVRSIKLEFEWRKIAFDNVMEVDFSFSNDGDFVATTNDEIVYPVHMERFHDVPKNGLIADFHHRLWSHRGFFRYPGTEAPCQYHCFHAVCPF